MFTDQVVTLHDSDISDITTRSYASVLSSLYGSISLQVGTLLDTLQNDNNPDREFELRFMDDINGHTSVNTWQTLSSHLNGQIEEVSYDDDILVSYIPANNITGVHVRSFINSGRYEKKVMIASLTTPQNTNTPTFNIRLSRESNISPFKVSAYNKVFNYQRRQRKSYSFVDPALSDWRMDKTIRFVTEDPLDARLTAKLQNDNVETLKCYDEIDIEFEFIGDFKRIKESFFRLIACVMLTYKLFDVDYLNASTVLGVDITSIYPKIRLITNNVMLKTTPLDYVVLPKYAGDRCGIVAFNGKVFELTSSTFRCIAQTSRHKDDNEVVYNIFDAVKCENHYVIIDAFMCDSVILNAKPFMDRLNAAKQFVKQNSLFELISPIKVKSSRWNNLPKTEGLILRVNETTFTDPTIYSYKPRTANTIDLMLCWSRFEHLYYLYAIGLRTQSISRSTVYDDNRLQYFGKSLLTMPDKEAANDQYMLFSTPFFKNSHVYKPSLNGSDIDRDMLKNPKHYHKRIVKFGVSKRGWVPIKIVNHDSPDSYESAITAMTNMYIEGHSTHSPFIRTMSLRPTVRTMMLKLVSTYEKSNDVINQYVIEDILAQNAYRVCLHASKQGINVTPMIQLTSLETLYVLSDDRTILAQYVYSAMNKEDGTKPFMRQTFIRESVPELSLYLINDKLTASTNEVLHDLSEVPEYTARSIDCVYIQDCLDKFETIPDILRFKNLCDEILSPNGHIIVKFVNYSKTIDYIDAVLDEEVDDGMIHKRNRFADMKFARRYTYTPTIPLKRACKDSYVTNDGVFDYLANGKCVPNVVESNVAKPNELNINIDESVRIEYGKYKVDIPIPSRCDSVFAKGSDECVASLVRSLACVYTPSVKHSLLTEVQKHNLRFALGLTCEYDATLYNATYEHWTSKHHNVEYMFGSTAFVSNEMVEENMLIESEYLTDDIRKIVKYRLFDDPRFSTVVVTRDVLPEDDHIQWFEHNGLNIYVIPSVYIESDIDIVMQYLEDSFDEPIVRYTAHVNFETLQEVVRSNMDVIFFDVIGRYFETIRDENPMTNDCVIKTMATNISFAKVKTIEKYMSCVDVKVLTRHE